MRNLLGEGGLTLEGVIVGGKVRQGRRECQRGGSSIRHTYTNELFMRNLLGEGGLTLEGRESETGKEGVSERGEQYKTHLC